MDDAVFRALADPTRRLLLDHLFEQSGQALRDLQARVPAMTRFGVMKHLKVLEQAGLVTTQRVGREKLHYLNAVPVQLMHDRWVSKYAHRRVEALADLKVRLEQQMTSVSDVQIHRVFIRATAEQIWAAITDPAFTRQYFFGSIVETTGEPGSPIRHYAPDGRTLWGDEVILEADPPRRLVHSWRSLYDPETAIEPPSRVTWQIDPRPDGVTELTVIHDQLEHSPRTAESVQGWAFVLSGMKTLLETGSPLAGHSAGQVPPRP